MDTITQYLEEIGRIPRLTPEQHNTLTRQMQHAATAQQTQKIRNKIVSAHLRLVVKEAKKFTQTGVPLLDLISEGNIGLIRAVEKFDPGRGRAFSTYATWWIRQRLLRALSEQGNGYSIPPHVADDLRRMRKAEATWLLTHEELPNGEELAELLDLSLDDIHALKGVPTLVALDEPTVHTLVAHEALDEGPQHPTDVETLFSLAHLTMKERQVLRIRFGLADGKSRTLKETGLQFGLSPERVRQVEGKALSKLQIQKSQARELLGAA